ncbi:MAG: hypothetical protein H6924_12290 [Alphaproteobacteria bacterium]|nr:hypothetical protein [Alphaproteobacteria bacterium]
MSGDFEPAVKFGATHVRVGSAIFGIALKRRRFGATTILSLSRSCFSAPPAPERVALRSGGGSKIGPRQMVEDRAALLATTGRRCADFTSTQVIEILKRHISRLAA